MMKDDVWLDKRSGAAGGIAGNAVIRVLVRAAGPIRRRKGVTFVSPTTLYVGRVCASDRYLLQPEVHWSTFDPSQFEELSDEARRSGKRLEYLFITAAPDSASIRYWLIPGDVVAAALKGPSRKKERSTFVRIRAQGSATFLFNTEVTAYQHELSLDTATAQRLLEAFRSGRRNRQAAGPARAETQTVGIGAKPADATLTSPVPPSRADETVRFTRRGQIAVPQWIRSELGIGDGTRALVYPESDHIVIKPILPGQHRRLRGALRGRGALAQLMAERRREREL